MSENKYPYIGKCKKGTIVLFYGDSVGVAIKHNAMPLGMVYENWYECKFENITHHYLTNTYGEVRDEAHAELIIKIAELAGFNIHKYFGLEPTQSYDGIFHIQKPTSTFNDFIFHNNCLFIGCGEMPSELRNPPIGFLISAKKRITIPLPPNSSVAEHEECGEWHKVGDDAMLGSYKVVVRCIFGDNAWCEYRDTPIGMATVKISNLCKLKTPEEQLFDAFWCEVGLFMNQSNLDKGIFKAAFINNIAKKPQ